MSNEDQVNELKHIIEEEKRKKLEKKEETNRIARETRASLAPEKLERQRQEQRERSAKVTPEKRAEYRAKSLERMTEEERAAYRRYNADRQKAYLDTVRPNWSKEYKQERNKKTTQAAVRKRLRIAGRPKPETCEVCGRGGNIVFEHSHSTGKFRGWTCDRCNVALGMVDDDIVVLEKLIVYLKAHQDDEGQ